jgi:hypothetical protein
MSVDAIVVIVVIMCAVILFIGKILLSSSKYGEARVHP